MSKTAIQWVQEGQTLGFKGKRAEAEVCYRNAITTNPECTDAYLELALVYESCQNFTKALEVYDQGLSIEPQETRLMIKKAILLYNFGKKVEAFKLADEAVAITPMLVLVPISRGLLARRDERREEAIFWFDKAIEIDPNIVQPYNNKALALRELGRHDEAIKTSLKAVEISQTGPTYNILAGHYKEKGDDKCLEYYDKATEINPSLASAFHNKAQHLIFKKRYEEALISTNKSMALITPNALDYAARGELFRLMNRNEESLEDFKKAYELHKAGPSGNSFSKGNIQWIEETLQKFIELQKISKEAETVAKAFTAGAPGAKHFLQTLDVLQAKKEEVAKKALDMNNKDTQETSKELDRLKQEFQKQIDAMKEEQQKMKTQIAQVENRVTTLENKFDEIKAELDTKMNDYNKKLDKKLLEMNMKKEHADKLKQYFKAFVETFSSIYITSQVIDSGQVSLDADSSKATVLSTLASFAPFVGGFLSTAVKKLGDFLESKEMKTNARIMKGMASDPTALSQIVGEAAYQIVLDPKKQKAILEVTPEDLEEKAGNLFAKVVAFCNKLSEQVDEYLYSKMYSTSAARLGHCDANDLIELWINKKIQPFDIESQLVRKILAKEQVASPLIHSPDSSPKKLGPERTDQQQQQQQSACCNMF